MAVSPKTKSRARRRAALAQVGNRLVYPLIWVSLALAFAAITCNFPGLGASAEPTPTLPADLAAWLQTPAASPTPTQGSAPAPQPTATALVLTPITNPSPPVLYYAQSGDSLEVVAARFGVDPLEISSPEAFPTEGLLKPGLLMIVPDRLDTTTPASHILPDSEVIYSPSAVDFDVRSFVAAAGGYLSTYREWLGSTGWTSGADIVARVALENSISPRLLLALLQYQSNWVYGQPGNLAQTDYPLGKIDYDRRELYAQLVWAVNNISVGYYGWREGRLTDLNFSDGSSQRLAPDLNAGSAALQYYFAILFSGDGWQKAISAESGLTATYEQMFGNPWLLAQTVEPLFPSALSQPPLILPFLRGQVWAFSGGPHGAWERDGAWAALDFAPSATEAGCTESFAWVVASAPGLVVRSERGVVVVDLDGDGYEQTGWALLYLHLATKGRVPVGTYVEAGDLLGKPSCEGGVSTGTHVHFARKFNGEWIAADGPLAFNLGGWRAYSLGTAYKGYLERDGERIYASDLGTAATNISRKPQDP